MKIKDINGNFVDIKGCYFSPIKGFGSDFYLYGILNNYSFKLKDVVLAKFGDYRLAASCCDCLAEMIQRDMLNKLAVERVLKGETYKTD